jgi:6-phospho-beta-glucosidase
VKIAVVGGGSTYTPELVEGLVRRERVLGLRELWLADLDAARLDAVAGFSCRMVASTGGSFTIHPTLDRTAALRDADFVITQLRVGGNEARHEDILLGLLHGLVGQETTGVGGFAKALRTVPVVLDVARETARVAPRARFINFTNPAGLVTEALVRHAPVEPIGLCNTPIGMKMDLAAALGVEEARLEVDYVGLNHLGWITAVSLDGEDITARVLDAMCEGGAAAAVPELQYPPGFLRALGAIPSPYLRYYYATDRMVRELQAAPRTRAEEVLDIEQRLLATYRDPGQCRKPALLEQRGGAWYSRLAVRVIEAIAGDTGDVHIVNVPHRGAVPGFSGESVLEVPCRIDARGAHALPRGPVPAHLRGPMQEAKAYEELTIEAAVTGSREKALLALAANPLVPTVELAVRLLDRLWPV